MVKRSTSKKKKDFSGKSWIFIVGGVALGFLIVGFFIMCLLGLLFSSGSSSTSSGFGNIALIPIEGAITAGSSSGYFGDSGASSTSIVSLIETAEEDSSVDAIVFWINSPGGSAVASDEIATAVLLSEKPTVAVIREVGASGAYWIASASDYVVANRMSITGSIGVISSYLEFSEFMEEYGINYQRLVSGESKDIGTPFRALASDEEELLQAKIDLIHDYFIDAVSENRGLERMTVAEAATGEFYLGSEALDLNLIDELGDLTTAEIYLEEVEGVVSSGYVEYTTASSLFDVLGSLSVLHGFAMGTSLGSELASSGTSGAIEVLV